MRENVKVIQKGKYADSVHNLIKLKKSQKEKYVKDLEKYAQVFLEKNFNMKLEIPIEICGRLTSSGGSFHLFDRKDRRESVKIKMSEKFIALALLDEDGIEAIIDILGHELVHYALFEKGSTEYSDGQKEFEETLARLNIGASGATNDKKILTKKRSIWYDMHDIYKNLLKDELNEYTHKKKAYDWVGQRIGYKVVKYEF